MVRGKAAKGRAAEDGLEEHVEGDAAPAAGQYRKAVDSKLGWDPHYTPGHFTGPFAGLAGLLAKEHRVLLSF